jgi:Fe-S cluster biogenesis protein NfuA/nitrite reductase/ring-hydroxylating ferredoxin subunit
MIATERREPGELVADVERRLDEIEALPDSVARDKATGLVQALLELYGAGLERMVDEIAPRDDGEIAHAFAADELISHLMLLHGLHPVALDDRVLDALGEVRPYLESHGGDVELLAVEGAAVRLRLQGSCSGCPSSTMTLKLAIENAIRKAAPEIEEVIAEEAGARAADAPSLLQIELAPGLDTASLAVVPGLAPASPSPAGGIDDQPTGSWLMAGGLPELSGGGLVVKPVGGQPILFLALAGRFYGYRPRCPACEESLAGAKLHGIELVCSGCGNRFDAFRAGRCLDEPQLHLEPVPLLVGDDGLVRVALAAGA